MDLPSSSPPLSRPSCHVTGRVFVITGGTQGLGLEIARTLRRAGAKGLVLVSRNREKGVSLELELTSLELTDSNCTCRFVYADLSTDAEQVIPQAIELMKNVGPISGVVNAAATTARGNLLSTSAQDFDTQMAINVRAPFLITQGAAKHMIETKQRGSIVNIGSCAAHGGAPFIMAYSVAKSALVTLTKNNAAELAPMGIRVNAINMGWCVTDNEDKIQRQRADDWVAKADASVPLGRILRPPDVAASVCYLLSDCSSMMTGSVLDLHPEFPHGMLSLKDSDSR
jgi:NAD(P)-dependent dehydrogenase (short-subunit alcohol dehydrogenase family)